MAAIVRPIEAKSVHQIQSGQVIVDLCSVVKELVENSLDADATAVEARFKNNGLDEIEVQDNGAGIAAVNYDSVALKHYTSKLSTYDDLSTLDTFGFRGEALSSLCALSTFTITTAQADEAPKGNRLDFETSGKLKGTTIVACQKGTTATVQNLFEKLPVRRKELSKNIKREYGKVLGLLHAYACVSINVKFTVKNAMPKGKSMIVFATKSNPTTRENIANIYGAKTLSALVALDLDLTFEPTTPQTAQEEPELSKVAVRGHISKPVFGEGRQTPDRQMFFVNGRPCGLPQIAKAINEVYKSFNVSQSPFIFADFRMNTKAYDVNVSPDKRTIFLHDATALTESLKKSLTDLFDQQDQTVPVHSTKLPSFKQLTVQRPSFEDAAKQSSPNQRRDLERVVDESTSAHTDEDCENSNRLLHDHFRDLASTREDPVAREDPALSAKLARDKQRRASKIAENIAEQAESSKGIDEYDDMHELNQQLSHGIEATEVDTAGDVHVRDFNARMAEQQSLKRSRTEDDDNSIGRRKAAPIYSLISPPAAEAAGVLSDALHNARPRKMQSEVATITIGDKIVTRLIGPQPSNNNDQSKLTMPTDRSRPVGSSSEMFAQNLRRFNSTQWQEVMDQDTSRDTGESSPESEVPATRSNLQGVHNEVEEDRFSPRRSTIEEESSSSPNNVESDDSAGPHEAEEKKAEEERVAALIRVAEMNALRDSRKGEKRAVLGLKRGGNKDSITTLAVETDLDLEALKLTVGSYVRSMSSMDQLKEDRDSVIDGLAGDPEERLSLTVSKSDFSNMRVVGQFNLGFILAVRPKHTGMLEQASRSNDELFIIDQHASDEKYNFERLQAETVVGNQRLVRPGILDLTAVEEEIVIDNTMALQKNGFIVEVDTSGEREIGKRVLLTSLPLSKEVVFGSNDLDELIHLLAESPMLNESSAIPRPSKVRKMFAMRACRSSIMIGKTLSKKQMSTVLHHMGTIDKPWNCPHGRPTMRHLACLDKLEAALWTEGDGVYPGDHLQISGSKSTSEVWSDFLQ